MGPGNTCVKVANDTFKVIKQHNYIVMHDGYGSGNVCQLPSIEGNKSTTHTLKQRKW